MPAPAPPVNGPGTHGKESIVAMKLNVGDAYVAIGNVSEWSLNRDRDRVEITSLHDANKRFVMGLSNCEGSLSVFADRTQDILFDAAEMTDPIYLAIWPHGSLSNQGWEGPCYFDASQKGGVTSAVTIDCKFVGSGNWTRSSQIAATGANGVSSPGSFTPVGAMAPANLAGMTGVTAAPTTAWPVGTYVRLGDGSTAHWSGTAWVAGIA
jgi:hypothetical protein